MKPVGHVSSLKQNTQECGLQPLRSERKKYRGGERRRHSLQKAYGGCNKSSGLLYNQFIMWLSFLPWTTNLWGPWMREHSRSPLKTYSYEWKEKRLSKNPHLIPILTSSGKEKHSHIRLLMKDYKSDSLKIHTRASLDLTHTINTEAIRALHWSIDRERSSGRVCMYVWETHYSHLSNSLIVRTSADMRLSKSAYVPAWTC